MAMLAPSVAWMEWLTAQLNAAGDHRRGGHGRPYDFPPCGCHHLRRMEQHAVMAHNEWAGR